VDAVRRGKEARTPSAPGQCVSLGRSALRLPLPSVLLCGPFPCLLCGEIGVHPGHTHSSALLRTWALMATITVLADMSTAPRAGVRRTPHSARTPAARGMATML
jgi:hypothetical protein